MLFGSGLIKISIVACLDGTNFSLWWRFAPSDRRHCPKLFKFQLISEVSLSGLDVWMESLPSHEICMKSKTHGHPPRKRTKHSRHQQMKEICLPHRWTDVECANKANYSYFLSFFADFRSCSIRLWSIGRWINSVCTGWHRFSRWRHFAGKSLDSRYATADSVQTPFKSTLDYQQRRSSLVAGQARYRWRIRGADSIARTSRMAHGLSVSRQIQIGTRFVDTLAWTRITLNRKSLTFSI